MSILSSSLYGMYTWRKGAFMHGKGFIKLKLRFNSSLEMFSKK
jgi:hypothetical protein